MIPAAGLQIVGSSVATLCQVLTRLDAVLAHVLATRPAASDGPRADGFVQSRPPRQLADLDGHPPGSRFRRLADAFDLTQVELDLVVLAAAPELDLRYGDAFGWLQGDSARRRPSAGLALELLGLTPVQRLGARQLLGPASTLVRSGLLRTGGTERAALPDRELCVDDRLAGFLVGDDNLDPALAELVEVVDLSNEGEPLVLAGGVRDRIEVLRAQPRPLCHLQGPEGSGRQGVAEVLARSWGIPALLRVRTDRLPREDDAASGTLVQLLGREAKLRGAALYWDRFDVLLEPGRTALRARVEAGLAGQPHAFVGSTADWPLGDRPAVVCVGLALPDAAAREVLWARALGEEAVAVLPGADLPALAGAFRLGPAAIREVVAEARATESVPSAAVLATAARNRGVAALGAEAQRVSQHYGWDDLVLPPDRVERLRALGNRVRHRALVHDRWGFAATLGPARGVAALFTGPSGTGKTMAAGIVAGSLGLKLYRVDLAELVSKYIGETEKNLARVFAAAEAADVVLFFDEADALFGRRTEVRDAHDRYANLEVSYLLQRVESHDGVVILATNLRKNVDEAFLRRLQFVIEFPLPAAADRRRIWERVLPPAAPRDPALDLDLLADRFELSGGSIRNVAAEAAFAAAAGGRPIGPEHVLTALRHEHLKLGRVAAVRAWQGVDGRGPLVRSAG